MKSKIERKREQDGRFALMLESQAAIEHDRRVSIAREQRRQQVIAENAEWAKAHGMDPSEMDMMFA